MREGHGIYCIGCSDKHKINRRNNTGLRVSCVLCRGLVRLWVSAKVAFSSTEASSRTLEYIDAQVTENL